MTLSLDDIDKWIRAAQGKAAAEALEKRFRRRIPRQDVGRFANLCWRANLPELGVRALHPIVRPSGRMDRIPSARETAEYAVCLIKIGAWDEGIALLGTVSREEVPECPLYTAFAHIARWEYGRALLVPRPGDAAAEISPLLHRLKALHPASSLTAAEASRLLGTSRKTAIRLLAKGKELGVVERKGSKPTTRYLWKAA